MRTLNVRFATILLVSVVVFAGAVEGVRRFQVWRKADFYLEQAEKAMREAERAAEAGADGRELTAYRDAATNYRWYLSLKPYEGEVLEEFGLLQANLYRIVLASGPKDTPREREETAAKARRWLRDAIGTLEAALREERESDRTVARRKLVEIYLSIGQFLDARTHIERLLENSPADGELLEMLGACQQATGDTDQAAESFVQAIKCAPERVNAYKLLVRLLADRNVNRREEADQWMRTLLEANPDSFEAHLAYCEYLIRLRMVNSIDAARNHPILLDTVVPAILSKVVHQAVAALELADDDPDGQLLTKNTPLLVQAVRDGLKIYDGSLALDDPGTLLLTSREGMDVEATDSKLKEARDEVIKALQSDGASADGATLSAAAKHGVLVAAMRSALEALSSPNALLVATRAELLDEATRHALKTRQLVADGRNALLSLFLQDFSKDDREIIRLAEEHGILLKAMEGALATEDPEALPVVLGRTNRRASFIKAIEDAIKATEDQELAEELQRLNEKRRILVGLMRHVVRDCEPASTDRDLLLKTGENGALARVVKQSLAVKQGVLAEAVKNVLKANDVPSVSSLTFNRKTLVEALERAIETVELPQQERDILLLEAQRGVLADTLKRALRDPELASSDRDELLQEAEGRVLHRVVRRAIQGAEWNLERNDPTALLLAAQCALWKDEYDEAREYANRGIELYLRDYRMYSMASKIALRAGEPEKALDEALDVLQRGMDATKSPQLLLRKCELLLDKGKIQEARVSIAELRKAGYYSEALVAFLQARAEYELGHWLAAVKGFEAIRGGLAASPSQLKQADFLTARCYGRLENVDEELKAYRRALDVDPLYIQAKLGLAEALAKAGLIEEALLEYRQVINMGTSSEGGWLYLVQLLLDRNRRLPPSKRNWQEVEQVLAEAQKQVPDSSQLVFVRARVLVSQAEEQSILAKLAESAPEQQEASAKSKQLFDEAERLLLDARDKDPEKVEYWSALARLIGRNQEWDRVASLLDEAEAKLGDSVVLRLARADYLAGRFGKDASEKLRQLAEDVEQFDEAQQRQLWYGLVPTAEQVGDDEQSRKLCRRVAAKEPNNLRIRGTLLELAFRSGNDAGIKETLRDVERIEGRGPLWLFGEAVRLSLLAKGKDDKVLAQALKHLAQARKLRPSWSRIPLVTAEIYDQQGNSVAAIESYLQAINMGEYGPVAIRRTIELLYSQNRFREAGQLLSYLKEIPPELLETAGRIDLKLGMFEPALEKARLNAANSEDYSDHIWLGQLLSEKGRRARAGGSPAESQDALAEAEKSLQRAVELAEEVPETWVALVQVLASTGQTKKAEDTMKLASEKIPEDRRLLALAQCHERMGRPELAQQSYEEALAAAPQDPAVARYVADFYLRRGEYLQSDPTERSQAILRAEAILKRIIGGDAKGKQADILWGRRRLALILLTRGSYQSGQEALKLIEDNLAEARTSVEDLRFKASILARDPRTREQATRIIENLPQGLRAETAQNRFMLWQLYLAEGDWASANSQMLNLLAEHADQPMYLATYISALLERNETEGCEVWLEKLEGIAPNYSQVVSLRAEWLFQRKQYDEALDLMNRFVGNFAAQPADEAERSRLVSLVLEDFARRLRALGEDELSERYLFDAESLCRKYVRRRPGREWVLVLFLGRQGRIEDALSLLEPIWIDSGPLPTAQASLELLTSPAATQEQVQRIEKLVQAALKQFGRPIPLLLVMAQTCAAQQRYPEAETYYREVIQKNGEAYDAMNNLAVLLALQRSKLDEALKLVTRAIELAGPSAPILDSRASVYLAMGQPRKALADLAKSIAEEATPVRRFHQAQAYQQNRQQQDAVRALKAAQKSGLKAEILEPLERPAYHELLKLLK